MSEAKSKGPLSHEEGRRIAEQFAAKTVQEILVFHDSYLDEHPGFDEDMGYADGESSRQPCGLPDLPDANEPAVQALAQRYLELLVNRGLVTSAL